MQSFARRNFFAKYFRCFVVPLLLFGFSPFVTACKLFQSSSDVEHVVVKVPLRTEPFLWSDLTFEQFAANVLPGIMTSATVANYIPSATEPSKTIQDAMNRIHQIVVRKYPALANVPQPKAALFSDSLPGAFVETVNLCFQKPVLLSNDALKPPLERNVRLSENGILADAESCIPARPELLPNGIGFINSLSHGCKIEDKGNILVLGSKCKVNKYFEKYSHSNGFALRSVSSQIFFSTGLVQGFQNQAQMLTVIMHELGHYYRAHPLLPKKDFEVFYSVGPVNQPARPMPDPALTQLAEQGNFAELTRIMNERRLGYYTFEQEADDFSLEFLNELGVPARAGGDALLEFLRKSPPNRGDLDFAACSALRAQGWLDANKQPAYVPVGNLNDPHHSLCYRVFNMDREIAAHGYK